MKHSLDWISRGGLLAALAALTGCPEEVVNPFESGGTEGSSSGDDGVVTTKGDDGGSGSSGAVVDDSTSDTGDTDSVDDDATTGPGTTGDGGGTTGDTTSGGAESSSDATTGPMGTMCPAEMLNVAPTSVSDSTVGEADEFGGSCGGYGSPDYTYQFTAPADGMYVFDTTGSSLDTVLYVLDGDCSGTELACNDDANGNSSEVAVPLLADDVVTVVVDGFALAGGSFNLHVTYYEGTCPDGDAGNAIPVLQTGDTTMSDNTLAGSCGGNNSSDDAFTFTAPQDGTYLIDTLGSDFDTVLYVRDACDGSELACNDDIDGTEDSSILQLSLNQDDEVVVVVDGNDAEGNYQLNIDLDACPDEALPSTAPQTVTGTTAADIDSSTPSCGFSSATDYAYTFVAPQNGTYVFDTFGSSFDTILSVVDGATCDTTTTIDCNDDTGGASSQVVANLAMGQEVTIIVDGYSSNNGAFTLNIDVLDGMCPDSDLGNTVPQTVTGDTSSSGNTTGGSCGGLSGVDDTFVFTAPSDATYIFDTVGSAVASSLYVLDSNDCTGMELACNAGTTSSTVTLPLMQDQEVTVVVDTDVAGAYSLNIDIDACPNEDLGSMLPVSVTGSTSGQSDTLTPSCPTFSTAGDYSYLWTAPSTGSFTFDTEGSSYDTALSILDGNTCDASELACDDDSGTGTLSSITLSLTMGQQVIVNVDGYNTNEGPYTLNIN